MKTTENEQTQLTETTLVLAIPSCVAATTLKSIEQKDIKCDYLGVDEERRLLMKLSCFEWQGKLLQEIISEMKEGEAAVILLLAIAGEILVQACKQYMAENNEKLKEYFKYNGSK